MTSTTCKFAHTSGLARPIRSVGRGAAAIGFLSAAVLMPAQAHAGFFEQLFGLQPGPVAQQPAAVPPGYDDTVRRAPRPVRRHVAAQTIGSGKQTPTDLMHDKTLHQGDAVMMKGGLHIYEGSQRGVHEADDFVPLDQSGLPRKERVALAAVDATHASVVDKDAGAAGTLVSGRSAAVSAPIVEGRMISDARGNKVRYIGP